MDRAVGGNALPTGITAGQIRDWQDRLGVTVDGLWGNRTQAAYNTYQNQTRLNNLLNMANSGTNVSGAYDAAADSFKRAENAAYEATRAGLWKQGDKVADQYNDIRSQAYVNARLKAVGNNEALASKGLSGSLYDGAQSGVSETSRIAQDSSMRNDINYATRAEQATIDEIAQAIIQAGLTRDRNIAARLAELSVQRANAIAAARQQDYENAFKERQYADSRTK